MARSEGTLPPGWETTTGFSILDSCHTGVTLTTVNRSLEVVRRVLNLAARQWRHPNRLTWLETAPLITLDKDKAARKPYPLSWDEQRRLFSELPADPNAQMALFKVNTGTREQEVCKLEWDWEIAVPELGELINAVNRIDSSRETPVITVLRAPQAAKCLARVLQQKRRAGTGRP